MITAVEVLTAIIVLIPPLGMILYHRGWLKGWHEHKKIVDPVFDAMLGNEKQRVKPTLTVVKPQAGKD